MSTHLSGTHLHPHVKIKKELHSQLPDSYCEMKVAHASISVRRLSNASPRRYACSALSPITWARACSASSRGKLVSLPAQSRNELLKPWTVAFSIFIRRSIISMAMLDNGFPAFWPGKTKSPMRAAPMTSRISMALPVNGTRCWRPAFMRSAGIVQIWPSIPISAQRAPSTSPVLAAVRMQNSSARPAIALRCRRVSTKAGTSAYGIAA